MGKEKVSVLKDRTDAKIDYAKLMLDELSTRPSSAGRGNPFERAHEEAVLFHVIGAKDAFLQEINEAYDVGIDSYKVNEYALEKALKKQNETCLAFSELMKLKRDESSWLYEAIRFRNYGTHNIGLSRTSFLGGEHDDKVFYHDPRDPSRHIAEEDTYEYLEHCIQEMEALILRLRDTLSDWIFYQCQVNYGLPCEVVADG